MKLRLIILSTFCFITGGLQAANTARAAANPNAQAFYPQPDQIAPRQAYPNAYFGNAQARTPRACTATARISNNARAKNFRP
jgi:hypothetical protein